MENPEFSKADKRVYDYPAFLPEKYDDQPAAANATDKVASTDSAKKSITDGNSVVMNMKNPIYVPTSKTQAVNEEALNAD